MRSDASGRRVVPSESEAYRGISGSGEQEPRKCGYLWRITGDRQLASDLCQETFLRAWNAYAKVRGYQNQTAWLLHIATNLALNSRRRRTTRIGALLTLDETTEPSVSGDHAVRIAEKDAVHQVLLALPVPMRAAMEPVAARPAEV